MQLFGLLGLLVTIALVAWWLIAAGPAAAPQTDPDTMSTYQNAIESAEEAAEALR